MANTAASIIRSLVSNLTNFNPEEIRLSGEIPKDYDLHKGEEYSSSCGSRFDLYSLLGFHPQNGMIEIPTSNSWSTGSGEHCELEPSYLYNVKGVDEFIFFVETNKYNAGSWNGAQTKEYCTVYKAPNFKEHINKLNAQDLERWENWILQ